MFQLWLILIIFKVVAFYNNGVDFKSAIISIVFFTICSLIAVRFVPIIIMGKAIDIDGTRLKLSIGTTALVLILLSTFTMSYFLPNYSKFI